MVARLVLIENYAKNILRFRVTEPGGRELRPALVRKQTWRIDTKGISRITVEFDYQAAVLSANQARIALDYAFFTGTQLFLLPEGHRARPGTVRFDVPNGWKIASGLDETADPMVFTAPDYDTLVDQPTLMGQFDVTRFMVDGKPHDFVANPPGAFSAENTRTLIGHLTKLAETQGKIFGGLPYRKFVYFYLFRRAESEWRWCWNIRTRTSPSGTPRPRCSPTAWSGRPRTNFFTSGTSSGSVRCRCGPTTTRGRTRRRCCGCLRASRRITPA